MQLSTYEAHNHKDPNFPIIFHLDTRQEEEEGFPVHWHESLELLFIVEGECEVTGNGMVSIASVGDVVIFSSNCIHTVRAISPISRYYCLIVDKFFCDGFGVPVGDKQFTQVVRDWRIRECYQSIVREMEEQPLYYKEAVKSLSLQLLVRCCRHYAFAADSAPAGDSRRSEMVKNAVSYLRAHFTEQVTVDELCAHVGFSKYYFCREFKALTGRTVVDYLNFLRCSNARRLMASGKYNVSESASMSGFKSLSYFSRVYRRQMGVLPSAESEGAKL